ncbi:hypothetical protein [Caballeronia zhejiangensis]|uniref:hypothetical protein n=1 Tax=Caballeronia zhejiangensis TaxID=871203 RepID=UPI001F523339|nr:hypothetical protein [Caballeronia zhejiangensis]MCI1046937.1 SGNH/GDSL hydrolase family protein [Caballeronia zhejiangensis]
MNDQRIKFFWDNKTFAGDFHLAGLERSYHSLDHPEEIAKVPRERRENRDYTDRYFTYKFNQLGFRSDELDSECDNRILFAGDSFALGEGVPLDRLWCYRYLQFVAQQTGKPLHYYNVGASGASSRRILRNVIAATTQYQFDKVIAIFAHWSRISVVVEAEWKMLIPTDFQPGFRRRMGGLDSKAMFKAVNEETLFVNWLQDILMCKMHCDSKGVPFHWFTWVNDLDPAVLPEALQDCMIPISTLPEHQPTQFTFARDGCHFGDAQNNLWYESLKLYFKDKNNG